MAGHEIFVCYSSKDEARARELLEFLEGRGFRCWISSRDVHPGHNYQEAIVAALRGARLVVFLLSEFSNNTSEVKKELSLASSFDVPVIPVRLSAVAPNAALLYELATRQWIDVFPQFEAAMEKVLAAVQGTLRSAGESDAPAMVSPPTAAAPRPPALTATSGDRPPIVAPGSEKFEAIRGLLAQHVGPIAKVLVHKAATGAASADEFCNQLAAYIKSTEQREAFVRNVRARLSGGA